MNIHWLTLSLAALWPTCALAQTSSPSSASKTPAVLSVEPAAQAIVDRATHNYEDLDDIQFTVVRALDGRNGRKDLGSALIRYSAPDKLNITDQVRRSITKVVSDGSNLYTVIGSQYYKSPVTAQGVASQLASRSKAGEILGEMMKGNNPFAAIHHMYSQLPAKDFTDSAVVALGPRLVDGDVLHGIQYSYSARFAAFPEEDPSTTQEQITAWFGGSPFLLRRIQSRTTLEGITTTWGEKVIEQQLTPTFPNGTFQWDDTGLKPASDDDNGPYWDPRLKVGTIPFAFSAQDLQGRTLSLQKYKGKVVLLDFWATWCGPCVAGLPEIKSAYDKYHTKGLEVVGISSDTNRKQLVSFIKTRKMAWPQVFDSKSQVSAIYSVKAIPFLLLVGKDGKIAAVNPRGDIDNAVKAALAKS